MLSSILAAVFRVRGKIVNPLDIETREKKEINLEKKVSLFNIFLTFIHIGTTTFGGMWAATQKLEKELVTRRKWITSDELQALFITSTLIPAPKFLGLSGLVGFQMGKWLGAMAAVVGLITPPALLVLLGVFFVQPELLQGPLAPLNKLIGIGVVGILFGNAYHQIRGTKGSIRKHIKGISLFLILFLSIIMGVPLIIAAIIGFIAGAIFIREEKQLANEEGE